MDTIQKSLPVSVGTLHFPWDTFCAATLGTLLLATLGLNFTDLTMVCSMENITVTHLASFVQTACLTGSVGIVGTQINFILAVTLLVAFFPLLGWGLYFGTKIPPLISMIAASLKEIKKKEEGDVKKSDGEKEKSNLEPKVEKTRDERVDELYGEIEKSEFAQLRPHLKRIALKTFKEVGSFNSEPFMLVSEHSLLLTGVKSEDHTNWLSLDDHHFACGYIVTSAFHLVFTFGVTALFVSFVVWAALSRDNVICVTEIPRSTLNYVDPAFSTALPLKVFSGSCRIAGIGKAFSIAVLGLITAVASLVASIFKFWFSLSLLGHNFLKNTSHPLLRYYGPKSDLIFVLQAIKYSNPALFNEIELYLAFENLMFLGKWGKGKPEKETYEHSQDQYARKQYAIVAESGETEVAIKDIFGAIMKTRVDNFIKKSSRHEEGNEYSELFKNIRESLVSLPGQ